MNSALLVSFVLAIMGPGLMWCQSLKMVWKPQDMYNPWTDSEQCGLGVNEKGYICDPNRIVGNHIRTFQQILSDVATNGTKCPCSTYQCENNNNRANGYRILIALVKKMKIQKGRNNQLNSPEGQAQLFAHYLESEKWNFGHCEEDIVIFYSQEDQVLAIHGGQTALIKLTPYYRGLLAYKVGSRFKEGRVIDALHHLIYDMKLILNCKPNEYDCGVHEIIKDSASFSSISSVALISLTVLFTSLNTVWS